ncbi:nucleotide exchange factor GrpE [Companilactobacillus sp.]|uniref:nucleotide exchange factor GrpE n=1 Tax=Companilactobacillus sp. TaxID=2767905 RepID=UPI0025C12C71|nr:nucleotide exchange factor GrpE [Companilactobacillus sp.]MCH4008093.1 nucleotide exchange factor GrpE [Companilactobacillus sp.]MCH4051728.1 nucleotide exchange factor GrpE [Companilactobacillus sp.]MCH4076036.1 nucleotide exchange factor GrpE [Companilactobacillus sp.]MCH4124611.1 nucleotide exchange factor GrpE [Companilactobacillus sp.]MCH4132426.1 nucleotide exchange factor GrpE [Companilactobacillus sp.]
MSDKEKEKKTEVSEDETNAATKEAKDSTKKETSKTETNKTADLEKQIADLQKKNDELEDKYIRSQAEIQNMAARQKKEVAGIIKYDGQKLAKEILPVLDNLERALSVEATDETGKQLKKGVEMVQQHMIKAFDDNNVTVIDNVGEKFDPNDSQAVQTVPADDDHPADTVVQVLQKGYKLNDRVLRPAMVIVAQ